MFLGLHAWLGIDSGLEKPLGSSKLTGLPFAQGTELSERFEPLILLLQRCRRQALYSFLHSQVFFCVPHPGSATIVMMIIEQPQPLLDVFLSLASKCERGLFFTHSFFVEVHACLAGWTPGVTLSCGLCTHASLKLHVSGCGAHT